MLLAVSVLCFMRIIYIAKKRKKGWREGRKSVCRSILARKISRWRVNGVFVDENERQRRGY
jgi:hypothetical protein